MTMGEAQGAKKAHIAGKLALAPGQRVLDIGCGWGGMAITLAKLADVTVHGITLSQHQFALPPARAARAGVAYRVTFVPLDSRALATAATWPLRRLVVVGLFKLFCHTYYDTFFRSVVNLLPTERLTPSHL